MTYESDIPDSRSDISLTRMSVCSDIPGQPNAYETTAQLPPCQENCDMTSGRAPEVTRRRNARERRRVECVNSAFGELQRALPLSGRRRRVSKVKTLRQAIQYIDHLRTLIQLHDNVLEHSIQNRSRGPYPDLSNCDFPSPPQTSPPHCLSEPRGHIDMETLHIQGYNSYHGNSYVSGDVSHGYDVFQAWLPKVSTRLGLDFSS